MHEEPPWFKTAVIYQLHVRSFADSDGDGIGDFTGLTGRLDYLRELGVTAVWLLPFYPSPLGDDGYDIADYTAVNPLYGTLEDFQRFLAEAHRRDIRVITEVVLNHTSDQHEWFQRARHAPPGDPARDFYVWSDDPTRYPEARIIFGDFEESNWSWDDEAGAYFWHRFYHHQPDLNFDNPAVREAVTEVVDFWLGMGVDGLRLDAIPYLFERDGTTGENLPETHAFLKELRAHVDARHPDRMLLAEANQWPEDTREYFGDGDECHMAFHFPVMPRLYMSVAMEDRFALVDILEQTPAIPVSSQWAMFLRNHDELTLEMVTEEERDFMLRAYAPEPRARINLGIRRRLAPLVGNDRRRIELLNSLLFSLPGTPVVYYGDEIGMGDNVWLADRDGLRTPMQWSAELNAGFSTADPQRLVQPVSTDPEFRYENVNVQTQQANPHSLWAWMRRLIAIRKQHPAFGTGDLRFHHPDNATIVCFTRSTPDESLLVIANLSRSTQVAELELGDLAGTTPVELFGRTRFPVVGTAPYPVTLPPHGFLWFSLEPPAVDVGDGPGALPRVVAPAGWEGLVSDTRSRASLEAALPAVLAGRRWFAGKARTVSAVRIVDDVPLPLGPGRDDARILLAEVSYAEGEPETYVLPMVWAAGAGGTPDADEALVELTTGSTAEVDGLVLDAAYDPEVSAVLLDLIGGSRQVQHHGSLLTGIATPAYAAIMGGAPDLTPSVSRREQSNTSIRYGESLILKLFRRAPEGENPEWEIGRHLTERTSFTHAPAVAGALELTGADGTSRTLAVLQELVPHECDAWAHALARVSQFLTTADAAVATGRGDDLVPAPLMAGMHGLTPSAPVADALGPMLAEAALLGRRTAELHHALLGGADEPEFAPLPFTPHYQRSLYQSVRNQTQRAVALLRRRRGLLEGSDGQDADTVLAGEAALNALLAPLKDVWMAGVRIRTHGDYHLGQVLFTGDDFTIIDFEGEPMRPLSERRLRRSPWRDVAGMLRSFEYAAHAGLLRHAPEPSAAQADAAECWATWTGAAFLHGYLEAAGPVLVPGGPDDAEVLLRALLVEKAAYELGYELAHRPAWVGIPLHGLVALLEG